MLQLNNIDKTQLSEPVAQFLNTMELKHAKLQYCLTVSAIQNPTRPEFWQLRFEDTRFLGDSSIDHVGTVEWTYGSRSEKEYKVTSRKIQNDRFGHWGNEHASRRSKDMKKALKIAVETISPFEWHEISNKGRRHAEQAHEGWARKDQKAVQPFSSVGYEKIYEEIKYLVGMGIQFKTQEFKNAAAGMEAYEEFQRKIAVRAKFDTVIVRPDKAVYIPDGRALEAKEFGAVEALPDNTRTGIALLKLVGKDELLPEVGYRSGENTYFLLV